MKERLPILVAILAACAASVCGCTLKGRFYHEFAEAEYVFIGRVVGYAEEAKSAGSPAKTGAGLRVEPLGILNAPTMPEKYFEVFPMKLQPDCSQSGTPIGEVMKAYPAGTEVRVVMRDATVFRSNVPAGVVRLEQVAGLRGSLIENGIYNPRFRTTIEAEFDYRAFGYDARAADSYAQLSLIEFELRKDLYRLEVAKSRAERRSIMNRFRFAPKDADFDFKTIGYTFSR